jgi:hypothetical protein
MGLPDMTPGMNTAIETPPDLFSLPAPPLKGRTTQRIEMITNSRFFISASLKKFAGAKKKQPRQSRAVFRKKASARSGQRAQFSSIRTIPSAPEFHRFSLRRKRKIAGYTAGWELGSRL